MSKIPKDGEVDVVYLWIDSNKKDYQKTYKKLYEQNKGDSILNFGYAHDNKEILYSIKSVRKYMSWVRNIFIVLPAGDSVKGLDLKKYNVTLIKDDQLLTRDTPCFNSNAKECFLHKIEGLSEFYITFNDDFFITSEVSLDIFYNFKTNKIKYYYEDNLCFDKHLSITTQKVINSFNKNDEYYFWGVHMPKMFRKKDVMELATEFKEEFDFMQNSIFRSKYCFNIVTIYGYYLLHKNRGEFIFLKNNIHTSFINKLNDLYSRLPNFLLENTISSILKKIFFKLYPPKKNYINKIYSNAKIYANISISKNIKSNKLMLDYIINNPEIKFVCLGGTTDNDSKEIQEKIYKSSYLYFYNKLFK